LILDEPTNALDPAGVVEIRDLLRDLAAGGVALLLSSHLMAEVARLASRITILHRGEVRTEVSADALTPLRRPRLTVATGDNTTAARVLSDAGFVVEDHGTVLALTDEAALAAPEKIATLLVERQVPPSRLVVEQDDLETLFLRLVAEGGAA
jgi:ABC-2 type transport system ATP-binding protein